MMKCKNCKEEMIDEEQGEEDGMVTLIRKCPGCDWSCKSWYDLDECMSSNDSWLDETGDDVNKF